MRCIDHPSAANQTFLVSDGEDISTSELLTRLGHFLGSEAKLLPVPSWALYGAAALLGKKMIARRLCSSLQVDMSKTCSLLQWSPPHSLSEALKATAEEFLESRH
jgi:nucleoside-diphosphate-sugar epimerase